MEKLIAIVFTFYLSNAICQSADTLLVSKLTDMEWTKTYSNTTQFEYVKFEDGSFLKVGDKMKIGVPSGGTKRTFTYIMLGRMGSVLLSGGITYLGEAYKGREVTIENIKMYRSNKKDRPSTGSIIFNNPGMDISVLDLKPAIEFGEVINPKAAMTSDQALAELKKAKDKLDLGLITQAKFDSLRTNLSKYIN